MSATIASLPTPRIMVSVVLLCLWATLSSAFQTDCIQNRHSIRPLRRYSSSSAFSPLSPPSRVASRPLFWSKSSLTKFRTSSPYPKKTTSLQMSYGGGGRGPGGGNDLLSSLAPIATSVAIFGLLFFTPLGSVFFAITNSLLLLSILTPLLLLGAFQLWVSLNTIRGDCPSCGSPVVVPKNKEQGEDVTVCFNCGSFVRRTEDGKGIELCNAPPSDVGGFGTGSTNAFDMFGPFSGSGGGQQTVSTGGGEQVVVETKGKKDAKKSPKGDMPVIDVEVQKDD